MYLCLFKDELRPWSRCAYCPCMYVLLETKLRLRDMVCAAYVYMSEDGLVRVWRSDEVCHLHHGTVEPKRIDAEHVHISVHTTARGCMELQNIMYVHR